MIRHGETEANKAHVFAGSLDSPLTEKGREQAELAQNPARALAIKPSVVVHSTLSRARDTASIINESLDLPMFETLILSNAMWGIGRGNLMTL